jgi:hypothetical protein
MLQLLQHVAPLVSHLDGVFGHRSEGSREGLEVV